MLLKTGRKITISAARYQIHKLSKFVYDVFTVFTKCQGEGILWQKLETPDARLSMYECSQKENIPRVLVINIL